MARDDLAEYHAKRDFDRTPEPRGRRRRPAQRSSFVVHLHDARRLHYDVRLESGGVLKSWAVPKGPSTDPRDKRLAVRTEDHPLDYADFEGVIPKGDYGAGPVIVWDAGTYRNLTEHDGRPTSFHDGVERGHVKAWFDGVKLHGAYAFTRIRGQGNGATWLMVKMRDEAADPDHQPVVEQPASVQSGRTIDEMAASAS